VFRDELNPYLLQSSPSYFFYNKLFLIEERMPWIGDRGRKLSSCLGILVREGPFRCQFLTH